MLLPVGGDGGDAQLVQVPGGFVVGVLPVHGNGAVRRLFKAGQNLDQLRLAVAVDAGDAHDFAAAHVDRQAAQHFYLAVVAGVQVANGENRFPGLNGRFIDSELHVASDHHAGQIVLGDVTYIHS